VSAPFCAELEARLLRYVQIDTTSDATATTVPSTATQRDFQKMLAAELRALGAADVHLDAHGFLYAILPATTPHTAPRVALLAHVDTVAGVGDGAVKPRVHRGYDGAPIVFPNDALLVLMPELCPALHTKLGHDIVTASGDTLLGADDKAGVAILMTLAHYLLAHPETPHGELCLCFTPDEEIGTGIRHIDLARLGADVAYTLDGGEVGEITYETFSGDRATVTITGDGAGKYVNTRALAKRIVAMLPHAAQSPPTAGDREGYIYLARREATVAACTLHFILRDFENDKLAELGRVLQSICAAVQLSETCARITCSITPEYRNMRDRLQQDMRPVERAIAAIRSLGITPLSPPVRGATDGALLTALGVPTPNLFTGAQNIHSPLEWISVQDMAQAVAVLIELVQRWAEAAPLAPPRQPC
jgi:tripeptide aminopeptidase